MYNNYGFNPYLQNNMQRFQPIQPIEQNMQQSYIPTVQQNKITNLLGKSVDSVDVVKAMDIPLDGSISYFPLTDGSAIVTKQLMADGTSKTMTYRPAEEEQKDTPKYATIEDIEKSIKDIDLSDIDDLKDEIKELRQEIKELKKIKKKDE